MTISQMNLSSEGFFWLWKKIQNDKDVWSNLIESIGTYLLDYISPDVAYLVDEFLTEKDRYKKEIK
jgi:hypothetical protein